MLLILSGENQIITFEGRDQTHDYILGTNRVSNDDAHALCKLIAGNNARLASIDDKSTRDFISCKLSSIQEETKAEFSKDFWVDAYTDKMDSYRINPSEDLNEYGIYILEVYYVGQGSIYAHTIIK